MNIKRYSTSTAQPVRFDETGDGLWVKFDDHTTCVARLNMQIAELQNQLDINRDTVAEFVRREQQLAAEIQQSAAPCVICGGVSSRPNGEHYCHPKRTGERGAKHGQS